MVFTKYLVELSLKKGSFILLNTANGSTIEVDNDAYYKIRNKLIDAFSQEEKDFLKSMTILVEDDYDESVIKKLKYQLLEKKANIVFMTTEQCNFRCNYCYENHMNFSIKKDVYDDVIEYLKTIGQKEIIINWFGGEPTLEVDNIVYFMQKLYNLNNFSKIESSIITNGYLLTKKNLTRLIECGVNNFQITIDGLREEHNKNRHLINGHGTFDIIVRNLLLMKQTKYDFEVCLRYNYTESSNLIDFINFIYTIIGNDDRFILDFQSVGAWSSCESEIPLSRANESLDATFLQAKNLGMRVAKLNENDNPSGYFCVANISNSFIVNYKRELLKCTIKLDWPTNVIGTIENGGKITYNSNKDVWVVGKYNERCENCNVKPMCMNRFCPHIDYTHCKETLENELKKVLKAKYE